MFRIYFSLIFTFFCSVLFAQNPYPEIFKDEQLTSLKEGVNEEKIASITEAGIKDLAKALLNNSYKDNFRYKEYEAFLHPKNLARKLKISPYSQYENPTGIYFKEGETAQLWVNNPGNHKVKLRVTNWDDKHFKQKDYPLEKGYNEFKVTNKGNAYLLYFSEKKPDLPNIQVHMISGNINGVFDIDQHDNKDWKNLLQNAAGPVIDLKGKKVSLAYSV